MEYCLMLVTVPGKKLGEAIARALVDERLAACVNRVPGLESVYRWQGKIETGAEELLIVKTKQSLKDAVCQRVKELHSYQVPEVIAVPIIGGLPDYLNWVAHETR